MQGTQDNRHQWWLNIRNQLQKGYENFKFRGEEDIFDAKNMPLCLINDPKLARFNANAINVLSQSYMMFACRNLMKNAQLYASRNYERCIVYNS